MNVKLLSHNTILFIRFCKEYNIYSMVRKKFKNFFHLDAILTYCDVDSYILKIFSYLPLNYSPISDLKYNISILDLQWKMFYAKYIKFVL